MKSPAGKPDRRGRIYLRMRGAKTNRYVVETAIRMARTFRGEIRGTFVEDQELLMLSQMPFAREISITGRTVRRLTPDIIRAEMESAATTMRREFERLASLANIPVSFERAGEDAASRPEPQDEEPGIMVVLEPLAFTSPRDLERLVREFSEAHNIAGLMVAGNEVIRSSGPVVAVVEPGCDARLIVDTSERVAHDNDGQLIVVVVGDASERAELLAAARDAVDRGTTASFHPVDHLHPSILSEITRASKSGLVVGWLDGTMKPRVLADFACRILCPVLLLR